MGGYIPQIGFLGRDNYDGTLAPTLGFVFGSQIDIRNMALENGWLVSRNINYQDGTEDDSYYNNTYSQTHFNRFDIFFDIQPVRDLDIEISGTKTYTRNRVEQILSLIEKCSHTTCTPVNRSTHYFFPLEKILFLIRLFSSDVPRQ